MWAMARMVFAGWKAGEQWWLINPSVMVANYNRKNLRIFAVCIFVMIAMVIAYNVLMLTGKIRL
jgi:hypothetical protein